MSEETEKPDAQVASEQEKALNDAKEQAGKLTKLLQDREVKLRELEERLEESGSPTEKARSTSMVAVNHHGKSRYRCRR